MNDLYIEPYGETNDLDPIPCSECGEYLDPDTAFLVGDMSECAPECRACAEKAIEEAEEIGQNVHDRREDAETLLRDIGAWLANEHPVSPPEAVAFRAAIARR